MTRINVIAPEHLTDAHLLAELRELTRIPNLILAGKLAWHDAPKEYTVRTTANPSGGQGHVKFFATRLRWLYHRYVALHKECRSRGFKKVWTWPASALPSELCHDYEPTSAAIQLNITRILERFPKAGRLRSGLITQQQYAKLLRKHYGDLT